MGALHLTWMIFGVFLLSKQKHLQQEHEESLYREQRSSWLWYDIILGMLGVFTTVTAAHDFPHKLMNVNAKGQSGTLSPHAMVTQAEMIEHAFYQFLNVWQALYLHFLALTLAGPPRQARIMGRQGAALFLVTAPWLVRRRFPVHSFRHNWDLTPKEKRSDLETILYRLKKGQYLFYKHVVLHGINISVCIEPSTTLVYTKEWRLFWLCLNASYVMEFFLQSLVKRGVLQQSTMLTLNRLLMAVSSLAALSSVLFVVRWELCALSLVLNILNRHCDVMNTMLIAAFGLFTKLRTENQM